MSKFVNNFSEGNYEIKCKYGHDDEKCETCRINYKYYNCLLKYMNLKDHLMECKYLCCNNNYQ